MPTRNKTTPDQKYPFVITSTPEREFRVRTKAGGDYGPYKTLPDAIEGMKIIIKPEVHYYDETGKEILLSTEVPNA